MATPATISLEGFPTAILYKHWDGYPEATLQWLIDFNQDFIANRGDDPEYKFAQLLRSSAFEAEKYGLDPSKHTGWGVYPNTPDALSMGAFSYQLMKDGTVMVKEQD
jgi:hypothetical protein